MAHQDIYTCDHCGRELRETPLHPQGVSGWTISAEDGLWTMDLSTNKKGPCICTKCLNTLKGYSTDGWVRDSKEKNKDI